MKYRKLGNSGLMVSELGLGTAVFGENTKRGATAQECKTIIMEYLNADGNFIDTADSYANGASEGIVGETVKNIRDKVIIATKVFIPIVYS